MNSTTLFHKCDISRFNSWWALTHSHQDDVTKTQKLKDLCESYYLTHLNNTCNENSVSKKKGQYVRKAIGWRKITKKASFHYICQKKICGCALLCKQIKLNQKNWLGNNFRQPYDCLFELLDNKVVVMSWKDFVNIYQPSNSICSWGK